MRLVVDENVAHNVVELLRERGHAVELVGRISLQCSEAQARRRLEETIDLIEFEYARSRALRDQRLIVAVSTTTVMIVR
jgi:hypothetical protein